ncbi:MAG: CAP domain-containing protein [Paracoccaceae bacterium]
MRAVVQALITGVILVAGADVVSAACQPHSYSKAYLRPLPTSGIDQALFSRALMIEANFVRCQHRRRPLKLKRSLTDVSAAHSRWMARARNLSHASTVPGKRRLFGRALASRLPFRRASENLVALSHYRFGPEKFRILNASACRFAYHDGRAVPRHTYASLARDSVAMWMNSPGHRRNLLARGARLTGSGVGFDPHAPYCGTFYITQEYLG